jgi:mannose-6-phosphate isomerase class I
LAFAYRPIPYDDPIPVNPVGAELPTIDLPALLGKLDIRPGAFVALDGIATARFGDLVRQIGAGWEPVDVATLYRSTDELAEIFAPYLPDDRDIDPELIFGKLFDQSYDALFDPAKVQEFLADVAARQVPTLLHGLGSASDTLRQHASAVAFIDVTPKDAALRAFDKRYECLGVRPGQSFDEVIRQVFFIDLELSTRLRARLIVEDAVSGYVLDTDRGFQILEWADVRRALSELVSGPFRAKPVYVEGVWGGQFIKRLRGVPDELVDKVAWAFELIPTEASVLVGSGDTIIDVPYMTIMDAVGVDIVGDVLYRRFAGRFPVRFNYDDTWQSNGNMSIQVHPSDQMIQELHGDIAAQNEAYYIVLTGHGAKTYVGFKGDGREFLELCRISERDGSEVPYQDYIHSIDSAPGRQVFLPHGTVHSSGRNQLVLELGTITTGAYTYKIYDYNRPDITGKPRPIHTRLAEQALDFDRDGAWVEENVAFPARLVDEGPGWLDYLVGQHEDMYIETHRIELAAGQTYRGQSPTGFTVVSLVDGQTAHIRPVAGGRSYVAGYLDVVVLPATVQEWEVVADPRHPIVLHTTTIRSDRYETWQED